LNELVKWRIQLSKNSFSRPYLFETTILITSILLTTTIDTSIKALSILKNKNILIKYKLQTITTKNHKQTNKYENTNKYMKQTTNNNSTTIK